MDSDLIYMVFFVYHILILILILKNPNFCEMVIIYAEEDAKNSKFVQQHRR